MSFSDYLEGKIMNHLFRTTKWAAGGTDMYVTLLTATPADSATGSSVTEAGYTSMARVNVAALDANWTLTGTTITNTAAITFPTCTGSTSTVTYVMLVDASTAGNAYGFGALTTSKVISSGDTPQFAAGQLSITLD